MMVDADVTDAGRLEGYTLDDWESLDPQEGRRIDLVGGRFVVHAAPALQHQRVGDRLRTLLDAAVAREGMEALTAIGVRVDSMLGFISDVVVTSEFIDADSVDVRDVTLIVEVVSPPTKKTDGLEKPAAFAAAGVEGYWRVEMIGQDGLAIYCYRLSNGVYSHVATLTSGTVGTVAITSTAWVTFDPADLSRRCR
ncbi:Uma2 family endonuclease [Lentzea albidocapillata]|uniref:Endonuclease, Uma2 family (Restriction endonuclease fold) n=1 Tax=Lentzea albidocapillata TaxID=40571 RepID=A0A1W2FMI9_9PSEU|nr:Uma2 family endonuclease [Lentzea albidocapillata]SMD23199.1 Endonuclease, Uma2 family (restriction endonuclease fold) [Lentzea albidocapillata]